MDHQGQHGHGATGVDGYGNPAVEHGVVGQGAGPGGAPPAGTEEHRSRGILHRSSSCSSSSSSEDDGMGGRRKKGIKEKIKEKLPGGQKNAQNQQVAAGGTGAYGQQGHGTTTGTAAGDATTGEKKGLVDKIKEKLPGHH